jgi:hypothetical protein
MFVNLAVIWCTRSLLQGLLFALVVLPKDVLATVDQTRTYSDAYRSSCAFGIAHLEMLRRHKVLLVPGYFGDFDSNYFADQLQWLASMDVEREKVAVKSRQSVAINAPIIVTAIRDSIKPVILITHSKGSVDALDALRAEPSLRTKVKGWVSLQGVFFGSPVADMLLDGSQLDPLVAILILGYLGSTKESAQGLTTGASLSYYRNHKAVIDQVVREVPAIAFASALDTAPGTRPNTTLEIPHELMARRRIRSDGLVPLDAAVLPGMDFVKVSGIDHIAPVMPALQRLDRIRMTKALLLVLPKLFRDLPRDADCRELAN